MRIKGNEVRLIEMKADFVKELNLLQTKVD